MPQDGKPNNRAVAVARACLRAQYGFTPELLVDAAMPKAEIFLAMYDAAQRFAVPASDRHQPTDEPDVEDHDLRW